MCGLPQAVEKTLAFYGPPYIDVHMLSNIAIDTEEVVRDSIRLYEEQFDCCPVSTVAPNYCWTDRVERVWVECGIRYVQGTLCQVCPTEHGFVERPHYLGERSVTGCLYLVRNCTFEPAIELDKCLRRCLNEVALAFHFHQPALISTHRMNYVGSIDPTHRSRSLELLAQLLSGILGRWPDVWFISTRELGAMIEGELETPLRLTSTAGTQDSVE